MKHTLKIHNDKVVPKLWVSPDGKYARVYQSKYYKGWADSRGDSSKKIGGLSPGKPHDGTVSNGYWTLVPPGIDNAQPIKDLAKFDNREYVLEGVYPTSGEAHDNANAIVSSDKTRVVKTDKTFKYGESIKTGTNYLVYATVGE